MTPLTLALSVVLLVLSSSSAVLLDSSVHLARHQHIAAAVKRSPVSARCKARPPPSSASPSSVVATSTEPSRPSASASPKPSAKVGLAVNPKPSSKVGLAFAAEDSLLHNFVTPKVTTVYNWTPTSPTNREGLEYVPMFWGKNQTSDVQKFVKPGYANTLLGFNEPNLNTQSNLDPKSAAQIWMENALPLAAQGYTMIAPAVTTAPGGVSWLKTFFEACNGCKFDYLALHYYGTDPAGMIEYITMMHDTFQMNLWITEFACHDFAGPLADEAQISAFMSNITQWMDETEYIYKYFAYGVMKNININPLCGLMDDNGMPTQLGRSYIGS